MHNKMDNIFKDISIFVILVEFILFTEIARNTYF